MQVYATSIGATVIDALEDDISGTVPLRERPGGQSLYRYIDGRACDAVVFYTVDRVTRDEDLIEINVIRRDCRKAGIELHYANDGGKADLSTWGGVIDTLKAAGAAEERKKIVERNSRGRRAKALAGQWVGVGAEPFGYRRAGHGRQSGLEKYPDEILIVCRIFDLFLGSDGRKPMGIRRMTELFTDEGVPTPARADRSGKQNARGWHKRSIHMILTRELYAGVMTYGDVRVDMPELAVIDRATFDAAQERLKRNLQTATRNRKREYLLTGHIRCICGRAMTGSAKHGGRYRYYYCAGRGLPKHLRNCDGPLVTADLVEPAVWDWVERITTDDGALTAALEELAKRTAEDMQPRRDELARIEQDIERTRRAIGVWTVSYPDASGDDELGELKANVKAASVRLDTLRRNRDELAAEIEQGGVSQSHQREVLEGVQLWRDKLMRADYETKRYMLDRLHVACRLRRADDGLSLDIGLQLGVDNGGHIAFNASRIYEPESRSLSA